MSEKKRKAWILAELKTAVIRSRQTTLDIEAIGIALEHDLITPFQAIAMMYGRDCFGFFGKEQNNENRAVVERERGSAIKEDVRGGLHG